MNCEIIAVGTELTTGDINNTNATFLSQQLTEMGIEVVCQTAVDDNAAHITEALRTAISKYQLIIFTGGLGPTPDDLTKETVSKAVGRNLVINNDSMNRIELYFNSKGVKMPENNKKQAFFPEGSEIFPNSKGTADGCAISSGNQFIIMLPGPPAELIPMFENSVKKYLLGLLDKYIVTKTIKVFGKGESAVAEDIYDLLKLEDPTVATYVGNGGDIRIKITSIGDDLSECEEKCHKAYEILRYRLKNLIYDDEGHSLQETVVKKLLSENKKIATAESCTAGLLSKTLTDVAGASHVFEYGISAYANRVKIDMLGVEEDLINKYGAVSKEVAEKMAIGAAKVGKADVAIGITGFAGPDGGEGGKPAGLVYVSLFGDNMVYTKKLMLSASKGRDYVRECAVMEALNLLRLFLDHDRSIVELGRSVFKIESDKQGNDKNDKGEGIVMLPSDDNLSNPESEADETAVDVTDTESEPFDEDSNKEPDFINSDYVCVLSDDEQHENPQDEKSQEKKESRFKRAIMSFIPQKGDSKGQIMRKIVLIICLLVFLGSMGYIADYVYQSIWARNYNKGLSEMYNNTVNELDENGVNKRFYSMLETNPDTVGWIKVPNTKTDNPVVQGDDNDKYLHTTFEGEESKYGTIFADSRNVFERGGVLSKNTILYGHHMRDGEMMGEMKKYRDLEFYKENPYIEFTTIYSKETTYWKVFSIFIINTEPKDDNGNVFNYLITDFSSETDFNNFINECYQRSIINTSSADVTYSDNILTLSSCIYDFNNARLVIMARECRDGETPDVDTSNAIYNPDPVYPAVYYAKNGTEGRTSVDSNSKPVVTNSPYNSYVESTNSRDFSIEIDESGESIDSSTSSSSNSSSSSVSSAEESVADSTTSQSSEDSSVTDPASQIPPEPSSEPDTGGANDNQSTE